LHSIAISAIALLIFSTVTVVIKASVGCTKMDSNESVKNTPKRRKAKYMYVDGFVATEKLEELNIIGSNDVETQVRKNFPKGQKLWFQNHPLQVPPQSQSAGMFLDENKIAWGKRTGEPEMLNVTLPRASRYRIEGRTINFPELYTTQTVPGLGEFIVQDVIIPKGRRATAKVRVKWLFRA
jgi:hypothetical protein